MEEEEECSEGRIRVPRGGECRVLEQTVYDSCVHLHLCVGQAGAVVGGKAEVLQGWGFKGRGHTV